MRYGLFSYALQPAERTSVSFMGAILEEYLVKFSHKEKDFLCPVGGILLLRESGHWTNRIPLI